LKGFSFFFVPLATPFPDFVGINATTRCPYKGMATYWSVSIGEMIFKDIVWSYQEPLPEYTPIAHFLCLYNERVDAIYVDDELMPVPKTIWSE
jgi:uncharacterized protein (DUF427 family)